MYKDRDRAQQRARARPAARERRPGGLNNRPYCLPGAFVLEGPRSVMFMYLYLLIATVLKIDLRLDVGTL